MSRIPERDPWVDKNCISYWFPILRKAVPEHVPGTYLLPSPEDGLTKLLCGDEPCGWEPFLKQLEQFGAAVGFPCFLRSGHTSAKHSWKHTCRIEKPQDFGPHVCSIVDFSECCGIFGLPYNMWAVREWLHGPVIGIAPRYGDMPVRREFRVFIRDGAVQCVHPYWPEESLLEGGCDKDTMSRVEVMNSLDGGDRGALRVLASCVARAFTGYWSVDCLWTDRGWFVTDMAQGNDSWHWPDCPPAVESEVVKRG